MSAFSNCKREHWMYANEFVSFSCNSSGVSIHEKIHRQNDDREAQQQLTENNKKYIHWLLHWAFVHNWLLLTFSCFFLFIFWNVFGEATAEIHSRYLEHKNSQLKFKTLRVTTSLCVSHSLLFWNWNWNAWKVDKEVQRHFAKTHLRHLLCSLAYFLSLELRETWILSSVNLAAD